MSRILFDTNIVLDVLLNRPPHAQESVAVWEEIETGPSQGMLARRIIPAILQVFGVAAVNGAVLQEALQLPFSDFGDAVTAAAARSAGCDYIVTRDPKGFRGSPLRSFTPETLLPILRNE